MPILFDPKGAAPLAFDVKGMPSSFLIDLPARSGSRTWDTPDNVDDGYRQEIAAHRFRSK